MESKLAREIASNYLAAFNLQEGLIDVLHEYVVRMEEVRHEFLVNNTKYTSKLRKPKRGDITGLSYSIENDTFEVHYEDYYCGDTDYYTHRIPATRLDDALWVGSYEEELRQNHENAKKTAIEKKQEADTKAKESRRTLYLSLKGEFENED